MRTKKLLLHTAVLGGLLVLLLIPSAVPSAYSGFAGPLAITGAGPGSTADFTWFPSKHDDPPPHGWADSQPTNGKGDDPPPHG
jgi:hypothetical protein